MEMCATAGLAASAAIAAFGSVAVMAPMLGSERPGDAATPRMLAARAPVPSGLAARIMTRVRPAADARARTTPSTFCRHVAGIRDCAEAVEGRTAIVRNVARVSRLPSRRIARRLATRVPHLGAEARYLCRSTCATFRALHHGGC